MGETAQPIPHQPARINQMILVVAVALSVFQLWQGVTADLGSTFFRPIHLSWILILAFMKYPLVKDPNKNIHQKNTIPI